MRFLQLQLRAVGPFTDATLDLSAGHRGLHLIHGPNEAGKSSTLRALKYLLFGFPVQLKDDFLHRYGDLRVGAVLQSDAGERLEIVRRKAAKQTLRAADDTAVIEESELRRFLGNVGESQFETFFGLTHKALVEGGSALVEGKGDVGEILFSASGISDLHAVQKRLDEDCEKLYKKQAKNPVINALISQQNAAEKQADKLALKPAEWEEHQKKLHDLSERKRALEDVLAVLRKERSRIDRLRKGLRLIPERERWRSELAEVAAATLLPSDFRTRRQDVERDIAVQTSQRDRSQQEIERGEQQLAEVHLSESLLAQRENIADLYQSIGEYRGAVRDRPGLDARCRQHQNEAAAGLRSLEQELTLEAAAGVRITPAQKSAITNLAARYESLVVQEKTWAERAEAVSIQFDAARRQRESLSAAGDVSLLQAAVQSAGRSGDVEDQLQAARRECEKAERQLQSEVARLSLWTGTVENFVALRLPAIESVERAETEAAAVSSALKSIAERLSQREAEQDAAQRDCDALRRAHDVPTETELTEVRIRRDEAWRILSPAISGGTVDRAAAAAFVRESGLMGDIAPAFRTLVDRADELGDRLRRDATHAARRDELERRIVECGRDLERLTRDMESARQKQDSCEQDWIALWRASGIAPRSPREMLPFLRKHAELVRQHESLAELREKASRLELRCAEDVATLRRRLQEATGRSTPADVTRGEVLDLAAAVVEAAREASDERARTDREIERLEQELDGKGGARQKLDAIQADRRTWSKEWNEAIAGLPVRNSGEPGVATADLERLAQLQESLRHADDLRQRIDAIDRSCRTFTDKVQALCESIEPALAGTPPETAVAAINQRLTQALKEEELVRITKQKLDKERTRRTAASVKLDELMKQLVLLAREAGCTSADELPAAEARSETRRRAEEKLEDVEAQLREICGAASTNEFVEQCRQTDGDALAADVARLDTEITEKSRHLTDEISVQIGAEQHALDQFDSSDQAAAEKERAQDLAAQLATQVDEFARLKLAQIVLRRGIERYRERHQGPILSRAGEIFAALTCGSFSGLRQDFDSHGKPVLVGLRASTGQPVTVEGMSDGTADQIYLSVRLAWLEEYLSRHEAVPFIVDDVLIRFDDARSLETLRALAGLSSRTQVLFFTHHRHLVDLARQELPAETLFTHDLTRGT